MRDTVGGGHHPWQSHLQQGQQVGSEIDVGQLQGDIEARCHIAAEDVRQTQIRPACLDVELERGQHSRTAPLVNSGDREIERRRIDIGRRDSGISGQIEIEAQIRSLALENLQQRRLAFVGAGGQGIILPAHAHVEAELESILADIDVGHLQIGQGNSDIRNYRRQGRKVQFAIPAAADDERFLYRQQHACRIGRQAVNHVQQVDHGNDEVKLRYTAEQRRHIGGQIHHRIFAPHQV